MKPIIYTIIAIILIQTAFAECTELAGTGIIDKDTKLCSDTYHAAQGITIAKDNIILDCGTAVIRGNYQQGTGITIANRQNITITKCNILTYNVGVFITNSSNVHLYDNALLKNDVGVRMYNAYENRIEKHNDKSLIKPISALTSKYNTVLLGNKRIDREFCEVNACNTEKDMNPCEDNDFYCSPKCTPETDNDCKEKNTEKEKITPKITEEIKENKTEQPQNKTQQEKQEPEKKINFALYIAFYVIGFIIFQFIRYVKEFDKEDR